MEKIKKRLFFDIETSPNIAFVWSAGHKLSVPYNHIIKERAIICICYKWENEDKVYSLSWDKNQDDKKMLETFIKVANEANELVGHNGDKYDLPWIRTRCLVHNIEFFPNYTTIDTLKQSRSKFRFNSNRLDYIANFLQVGEKMETSFDLWKDIMVNNDKDALSKMIEYCKQDVIILEKIFQKMINFIPNKTHFGVLNGEEKHTCPECGSDNSILSKKRISASGIIKVQLQCKDCNKYYTISNKTYLEKIKEE